VLGLEAGFYVFIHTEDAELKTAPEGAVFKNLS